MLAVILSAVPIARAAPAAQIDSPTVAPPAQISYQIDASLDAVNDRIDGVCAFAWTNATGMPVAELWWRLDYNAIPGASMQIRTVIVDGAAASPAVTGTVMRVPLPSPVEAGGIVRGRLEWDARVPKNSRSLTGAHGREVFFDTWYPEIARSLNGQWMVHSDGLALRRDHELADYDVRLTVPAAWRVAATGRAAGRSDAGGTTTTHRFVQASVGGFMWAAAPDWTESVDTITPVPGGSPVDLRILLRSEHAGHAARYRSAGDLVLRRFSEWFGPYPYASLTIVDGPWNTDIDRSDFAAVVVVADRWRSAERASELERSIAAGVAGQWWATMMAFDELHDRPLGRGLGLYATARLLREEYPNTEYVTRFFGGHIPFVVRGLSIARSDRAVGAPGDEAADLARWLMTAERYFGWPLLQSILAAYVETHRFGRGSFDDVVVAFERVTGRDLHWFFSQIRERRTLDVAIGSATSEAVADGDGRQFNTTIELRRVGDATFAGRAHPSKAMSDRGAIPIAINFSNGEVVSETWDGRQRFKLLSFVGAAPVSSVQIDPDHMLAAETRRVDNTWSAQAGNSWIAWWGATKWMVWLQDHLLSIACLV